MKPVADGQALLRRFLKPRHAAANYDILLWQGRGEAETPAEDAHCRLYLTRDGERNSLTAGFSAFGPPVVVACADWACEWLAGRTIEDARGLSVQDIENGLALAPGQRYAALLVTDALEDALANGLANLGT